MGSNIDQTLGNTEIKAAIQFILKIIIHYVTQNINNYLPLQAYCTSCDLFSRKGNPKRSANRQSWFILFLLINHDSPLQFIFLYKASKIRSFNR